MNCREMLQQIIAKLTPERLREIIFDIAKSQAIGSRSGVSLPFILDALTKGLDLGTGAEGWSAQLKLKRAIMATVALIPGMQYVEGDA